VISFQQAAVSDQLKPKNYQLFSHSSKYKATNQGEKLISLRKDLLSEEFAKIYHIRAKVRSLIFTKILCT
jgi:hypothetical protein